MNKRLTTTPCVEVEASSNTTSVVQAREKAGCVESSAGSKSGRIWKRSPAAAWSWVGRVGVGQGSASQKGIFSF
ncbi:hypothetical protein EJB05_40524, partial [Eragrostis curvula]